MVELDLSLGCAIAGSLHIPNNGDVVLDGGHILVTSLVLEAYTCLAENVVYSNQHKTWSAGVHHCQIRSKRINDNCCEVVFLDFIFCLIFFVLQLSLQLKCFKTTALL